MIEIDKKNEIPKEKLFHNEKIKIYEKQVKFSQIVYWRDNLRTILAFDKIENEKRKRLDELSIEEITDFLVKRDELKLIELANSIKTNGIKTPIVLLDDNTLLDGNRRFFACSYLNMQYKQDPNVQKILSEIPAQVILREDITEKQKNKILAEANYVQDFKVPWSPDVKAKVIFDYYSDLKASNKAEHEIYDEIKDVYGLDKSDVNAYIESIQLSQEYIDRAGNDTDKRFKFREQVLKKFVYFWEFRNKSQHGRSQLNADELDIVKPLFFSIFENNFIKNVSQVESIGRAYRDPYLWELLIESNGSKIDLVHAMIQEEKAIKSAEDKVRNFRRWIDKQDPSKLSKATIALLDQLAEDISRLSYEPK